MSPRRRTSFLILGLLSLAQPVRAEDSLQPYVQRRVRVVAVVEDARAGGPIAAIEGRLLEVGPEGIRVQLEDRARWIDRTDLRSLQVETGRKRATWKGAGLGALCGLGVGILVASAITDDEPDPGLGSFEPLAEGSLATASIALTTLVGAVVGGGIGALHSSSRWSPAVSLVGSFSAADLAFGPSLRFSFQR